MSSSERALYRHLLEYASRDAVPGILARRVLDITLRHECASMMIRNGGLGFAALPEFVSFAQLRSAAKQPPHAQWSGVLQILG